MPENSGLLNKETIEGLEADRAVSKIAILVIVGMIFCFFFGYFLKIFVFGNANWQFLLFSFMAAVGFLVFYLLDVFFIKSFWISTLAIFLETLAFLSPFYDKISTTLLTVSFISFLILVLGDYLGHQELENMLEIKFWRISKKVVPKAVIALALFTGVVYLGVGDTGQQFFISESAFEKFISPISSPISKMSFIQDFLPGFNLSSTVEEFAKNLAENQLNAVPQTKLLPAAAKKELISQAAEELKKEISDFIGQPINPQAKVSETIYEIIVQKFIQLPVGVKNFIPFGMAVIIFLIIISFTLPIRWLATSLAYLIYESFIALGFSAVVMEGRSREIVLLK